MRISCSRSGYPVLSLERLERTTASLKAAGAEAATVQVLARARVFSVDAPGRGIGRGSISRPPYSATGLPSDRFGRSYADLHKARSPARNISIHTRGLGGGPDADAKPAERHGHRWQVRDCRRIACDRPLPVERRAAGRLQQVSVALGGT